MARVLLQDIDLGCQYDSPIECYPSSGAYILTYFDLHRTNPYLNVVVSYSKNLWAFLKIKNDTLLLVRVYAVFILSHFDKSVRGGGYSSCVSELMSIFMVLPTLVRSGRLQPPLRFFNHHSI